MWIVGFLAHPPSPLVGPTFSEVSINWSELSINGSKYVEAPLSLFTLLTKKCIPEMVIIMIILLLVPIFTSYFRAVITFKNLGNL